MKNKPPKKTVRTGSKSNQENRKNGQTNTYYEWTKFYFESSNDMTCPSSR